MSGRENELSVDLTRGVIQSDILIYGATPAGIAAAIEGVRNGKTVVVIEPTMWIGGMSASGIGVADIGQRKSIGGLAKEYFDQVKKIYGSTPGSLDGAAYEPHVAKKAFEDMLNACAIKVVTGSRLQSVAFSQNHIKSIITSNGSEYQAAVFVDASYEGDLMAKTGVSYTVGRESNSQYNETLNGVGISHLMIGQKVDPYRTPGKPASGILPHVFSTKLNPVGSEDKSVMAYNFRLCVTKNPDNAVPFTKPDNYDESEFEILARLSELVVKSRADRVSQGIIPASLLKVPMDYYLIYAPLPNGKFDLNSAGAFSTDYVGLGESYANGSYEKRAEIDQEIKRYMKSLLYFLKTSPRIPDYIRNEVASTGLCKDEFIDTNGWPHHLYIREGRRMIGSYVMSQNDIQGGLTVHDSIGVGSFYFDSHVTNRVVIGGYVNIEANNNTSIGQQYPISYRVITPQKDEMDNLLVPVCISASHAAYTSIRVEPSYMIMGQAAGAAASIAVEANTPVQDVDYSELAARLKKHNQILWPVQ
ncbi:FAD dependent oxidoreductase [Fluviicoccus keumensis]|uniref:FAD dependent oxidoreductase n=1 Tax=Fluviicoccus keumensis TaxID=1435465 RepID=A0A4Q7Z8P5_9GAMM|nr:FAD-dependent oxidoreductase [Fluviicoccus keumensis]RZU46838.1 FAD dependent oxidoreductase [Fluviicoccus keumensis]